MYQCANRQKVVSILIKRFQWEGMQGNGVRLKHTYHQSFAIGKKSRESLSALDQWRAIGGKPFAAAARHGNCLKLIRMCTDFCQLPEIVTSAFKLGLSAPNASSISIN